VRARVALGAGAIFCAAIGLYDLAYLLTVRQGLLIGPRATVLFPDFLVFHAAAVAWLQGKAAMIYDVAAFTRFQNELYVGRFNNPAAFRPFFYPPTWVLMLLPLAWLGASKAFAAFMTVTAGAATALVGRRDWPGWFAILVSPASVWVVIAGQNTFLSVALLHGGFGLLERSPAAAGILLGLLTYKPQLWALVPVALLAARQWRALAWMAGTVAAIGLASLGAFGLDFWRAFLVSAREGAGPEGASQMYTNFHTQIVTLFSAGRDIGLSPTAADALQLAGALAAVAAVWFAFRRFGPSEARTAVLAAATFMVGPYVMNYDLLLLMPAVVALYRLGARDGFRPAERLLLTLLWLLPTLGWLLNQLGLPLMPLVILLFGATAWKRAGGHAKTA
jgi:hypothetical protein